MTVIFKSKTKTALQAKTKAKKKQNEQAASLAAIAASAPTALLPGKMRLQRRRIKALKGLSRRVRKTEAEQVQRIASSIRRLKQSVPILIDQTGTIINGHIVVEALKKLGETEVWCAVVDHLDEEEKALLHVSLNRIGECGEWDYELLGSLLVELEEMEIDLEPTGFLGTELDILMSPTLDEELNKSEGDEQEPPASPVSEPGDLWLLGKHRILCGDATKAESYAGVLNGELAAAIFADCPWNIPIEDFVSGLGKKKHKNFTMGVGELSAEQFAEFCDVFHQLSTEDLADGGVFFSCIDWRSVDIIMNAGRKAGLDHINTAIWNKGTGGMGVPYRSAHELVVIFRKGKKLAVNNVELGKHGRDRTNVWTYPGANRPGSSSNKALAHHPTPKPVELVADALLDVTSRGALVLDPFLGSGTTILAAEKSGRRACGIELDPAYVDVAIKRWEAMTGKQARHDETGLSYSDLAAMRAGDGELEAA